MKDSKQTIVVKQGDLFFRIVSITIILLLCSIIINDCTGGDQLPPEVVYRYETDTIYIDREYQEKYEAAIKEVAKWKNAPPKTIIRWKEPDLEYVNITKIPDSILVVVDSLKERIAIADNYIKLLPKNPKLLELSLDRDTLGLNLLNIDGRVLTYNYPIYLDTYKYKWLEGNLNYTRTSTKTNKPKNNNFNNLYFNGGYDFITESPKIDVEYFFTLGRFKIEAHTGFQFRDVNAEVKMGYRLLK